MYKYDAIIVGGGPAGTSCALSLSDAGLRILLLDQYKFPRDKTCGDALSIDVVNQLGMLSETTASSFQQLVPKLPSSGVRIVSPALIPLDIPFLHGGKFKSGFICAREHFDNFLFSEVKKKGQVEMIENCVAKNVRSFAEGVEIATSQGNFSAEMLIGADGANSIVKRTFFKTPIQRKHHSAGLRVYYKGIEGLHPENFIELHFFKEILPGYLWIFPMAGGKANVGIGVLSSEISIKKINLREILQKYISSNKDLSRRFKNAQALEEIKGFGLPLGYEKRPISCERVLLTGDAAGLIDPFSGEGIGNAIRSGRVAADHIKECMKNRNFSEEFNSSYDKEIYRRMGKEFLISRNLQKLCRYPFLFNWVVKKASGNEYLQNFFKEALADVDVKSKLIRPAFYYNLIFR